MTSAPTAIIYHSENERLARGFICP
jgi:hypothetical protein